MFWNFDLTKGEQLAICFVVSLPLWLAFSLGFLAGRYL